VVVAMNTPASTFSARRLFSRLQPSVNSSAGSYTKPGLRQAVATAAAAATVVVAVVVVAEQAAQVAAAAAESLVQTPTPTLATHTFCDA
jgi:hypothetical protein